MLKGRKRRVTLKKKVVSNVRGVKKMFKKVNPKRKKAVRHNKRSAFDVFEYTDTRGTIGDTVKASTAMKAIERLKYHPKRTKGSIFIPEIDVTIPILEGLNTVSTTALKKALNPFGANIDVLSAYKKNPKKKVAKRKDVSAAKRRYDVAKYGKTVFADAVNKKYPLNTYEHVRAAISYFGMPRNFSEYSVKDQKIIAGRIAKEAKKYNIVISEEWKSKFKLPLSNKRKPVKNNRRNIAKNVITRRLPQRTNPAKKKVAVSLRAKEYKDYKGTITSPTIKGAYKTASEPINSPSRVYKGINRRGTRHRLPPGASAYIHGIVDAEKVKGVPMTQALAIGYDKARKKFKGIPKVNPFRNPEKVTLKDEPMAIQLYKEFHDYAPDSIIEVKGVPEFMDGKIWTELGGADAIQYKSDKWHKGKHSYYKHDFAKGGKVLTNPQGNVILIYNPKKAIKVKSEGIVG